MNIKLEDCGKEIEVPLINVSSNSEVLSTKRTVEMVIEGPTGRLVLFNNPTGRGFIKRQALQSEAIKAFMRKQQGE